MDFYYHKNKLYKKNRLETGHGRSLLKYNGNGIWSSENSENEFSNIELFKQFQFKQWIALKKSGEAWLQDGPYSSQDIFSKLESGEFQPNTMIWKKGLTKWVQLQETDEFKGIFKNQEFEPAYELLESVLEMKPLRVGPAEDKDQKILDTVTFSLKNYDFSDLPVHLEAKSVRTLPRKNSFVYRDVLVKSKRSSKVLKILILAMMLVVIYLFLK